MICKECLFNFEKPVQADGGFKGGETWPVCPHCRAPLSDKFEGKPVKKDYKRINR